MRSARPQTNRVAIGACVGIAIIVTTFIVWRRIASDTTQRGQRAELLRVIDGGRSNGPLKFSRADPTLACVSESGLDVQIWDIESGMRQFVLSQEGAVATRVDGLSFSTDGGLLAVTYRGRGVVVWDLHAQKELSHIYVSHPDHVAGAAITDDSLRLVTVTTRIGNSPRENELGNHSVTTWDIATAVKHDAHMLDPILEFKALAPNSKYAVFMRKDVDHVLYDVMAAKIAFTIDTDGGYCFSNDSSTLVSYDGRRIKLWDVPSGTVTRDLMLGDDHRPRGYPLVDRLSLSPDQKLLAIGALGEANVVGIVSLLTGDIISMVECCPPSMITSAVEFSSDGQVLGSMSESIDKRDRSVQAVLRLWRILGQRKGT